MKAILLAAGLGTRLRPITNNTPKCMVPIGGRPLLDYWLDNLEEGGIEEVLINLHHLPEIVKSYLKEKKTSLKIKTTFEPRLLNTGGTILANKDFFLPNPVMVIHADNFSKFEVNKFVQAFNERPPKISMTMMTFETDDPQNSGIVKINADGIVTEFYEKQKRNVGNKANAAVYIISSEVMAFMQNLNKNVIDFSLDVIPNFIGKINTFHNNVYHRDIGNFESLKKARLYQNQFING